MQLYFLKFRLLLLVSISLYSILSELSKRHMKKYTGNNTFLLGWENTLKTQNFVFIMDVKLPADLGSF